MCLFFTIKHSHYNKGYKYREFNCDVMVMNISMNLSLFKGGFIKSELDMKIVPLKVIWTNLEQ